MLKEERESHSPATSTSTTALTTLSMDISPPSQQVSVSPEHIHVVLFLSHTCDYVNPIEVLYTSTGHRFSMVWSFNVDYKFKPIVSKFPLNNNIYVPVCFIIYNYHYLLLL